MANNNVPLAIKSGLPFVKIFSVTLPASRPWWTSDSEFEVLSQIRRTDSGESNLLLDLKPYITMTFQAPDTIVIELEMTGADTRLLTSSGFYDVLLSDTGVIDGRGYIISHGPVKRTSIITAEEAVI